MDRFFDEEDSEDGVVKKRTPLELLEWGWGGLRLPGPGPGPGEFSDENSALLDGLLVRLRLPNGEENECIGEVELIFSDVPRCDNLWTPPDGDTFSVSIGGSVMGLNDG